jgi:dTDP-glucose 4,6-dehydratase
VARTPFGRFDRIYHLASPASPDAYGRLAVPTLLVNAVGTRRLLEIARRSSARFLLASTSEVYGDPLKHPQAETYWGNVNPIGPRSQYNEGKRFAEALTAAYVREHGLNARITRIFNTYGPRMRVDDGRMPSTFIAAALQGADIPVHGNGRQTRSLCYVVDTARGLIAAMERGEVGEVYNIGRADEVSVLEFARMVRRSAGSRSRIAFVTGRPEDVHRRRPDCRKARRDLRWRPRTSLAVGLRVTIAWYRQRLASKRR